MTDQEKIASLEKRVASVEAFLDHKIREVQHFAASIVGSSHYWRGAAQDQYHSQSLYQGEVVLPDTAFHGTSAPADDLGHRLIKPEPNSD